MCPNLVNKLGWQCCMNFSKKSLFNWKEAYCQLKKSNLMTIFIPSVDRKKNLTIWHYCERKICQTRLLFPFIHSRWMKKKPFAECTPRMINIKLYKSMWFSYQFLRCQLKRAWIINFRNYVCHILGMYYDNR